MKPHEILLSSRVSQTVNDLPAISWSVHPARQRPAALVVVIIVLALAGYGVTAWAGSVWAGGAAALGLAVSLSKFLWPTWYTVDAAGIHIRSPFSRQQLTWSQVRWCGYDERAAWISRSHTKSLWDMYRATTLEFAGNADAVIDVMRNYAAPEVPLQRRVERGRTDGAANDE